MLLLPKRQFPHQHNPTTTLHSFAEDNMLFTMSRVPYSVSVVPLFDLDEN
jgi:hypothetical protein